MASRLANSALAGCVCALAGCAPGASNLQQAAGACARAPQGHVEVYVPQASVTRVLGIVESRSGEHEGFVIRAGARTIRVEDNAGITGAIPLRAGESISLLGQYECDDGVIHWTHRDPSGRHAWGYIEADGRRYQ